MLLSAVLAAVGAPAADAAPVEDGRLPHGHTHAPAEIDEAHGPLLVQLTYTGEVMGNVLGGNRRGARYLDNLDIIVEADLERLAGWNGAQFHIYGLYNNGRSVSGLAGDTQAVSNIETGVSAFRLYEAWIDQKIGNSASLKIGLYDLNSEFDALDAAGLFVSSPHGIGTDFAQSGRNGPSIFPSTSLAARVEVSPAGRWKVRAAILDGVPGDPDHPKRTAIHLDGRDGALLVGEIEAPLDYGKLLVGHWRYTARFDLNDASGAARGNTGTYVRAELPLVGDSNRRIDGFARLGQASGRFNMFDSFVSGGLKFSGWVPGRDTDEFGIALASALTSPSYRRAAGAGRAETAVETTYRAQLADWLWIQPSVHYIRNPSADPATHDALLVGLRFEVSHSISGF